MAFNKDKAFEVSPDGFSIENGPIITGGADNPYGNDAPLGSHYYQLDGTEWKKSADSRRRNVQHF